MTELINYLAATYYLILLSLALSILAMFYSFQTEIDRLKPLRAYLIVYSIGLVLNMIYAATNRLTFIISKLLAFEDFAFTVFEIFVFTGILYKYISDRISKVIIKSIIAIYVAIIAALCIAFFNHNTENTLLVQKSYLIQAIAMLIITSIYFFDTFRNPLKNDVSNEPAFWVASAISLCLVCTIPATMLIIFSNGKDRSTLTGMYGIIHIFYGVLFVLLIRAFRCKPSFT